MRVQSLGQGDSLEEGMATHSNILAWRIPWTEETGWLAHWVSKSQVGMCLSTHALYFIFFSSYLSLIKSKLKALLVLIS